MAQPEPIYEKSFTLPLGYTFTARARPSTVHGTILKLLPWALVAALPAGRATKFATSAARRLSPLTKYNLR